MEHLTEIEIEQALDDNLPFLRKIFYKKHLESCEQCQKALEEARKHREFMSRINNGLERLRQASQESHSVLKSSYSTSLPKSE